MFMNHIFYGPGRIVARGLPKPTLFVRLQIKAVSKLYQKKLPHNLLLEISDNRLKCKPSLFHYQSELMISILNQHLQLVQ